MHGPIGKILIALGVFFILIGLLVLGLHKIGLWGKVPGDIHVRKGDLEFHFPLATCIIASILLSVLLSVFLKWFKK
jgi:hypothetical protein